MTVPDAETAQVAAHAALRAKIQAHPDVHNYQVEARLLEEFKTAALAAVGLNAHPKAADVWGVAARYVSREDGFHWYNREEMLDILLDLAHLVK